MFTSYLNQHAIIVISHPLLDFQELFSCCKSNTKEKWHAVIYLTGPSEKKSLETTYVKLKLN